MRLPHHVRWASNVVPVPRRRGRNLAERYRTLEHSNRAKSERTTHLSLLSQGSSSAAELQSNSPRRTTTTPKTIAGFVIPEQPRAPTDDECCMSGCAVCVYDLYEDALAAYKDSVTTLRAALSALHIPEAQWPAHIRVGSGKETVPTTTEKSKDAVLNAFEEMERALKEKRAKRATVEAQKSARGEVLVEEQAELGLREVYESIKWILFPTR